MSAPATIGILTLEQKLEQGVARLIELNSILPNGYRVSTGIGEQDLALPAVVVRCEQANHHEAVKENFVARVMVTVMTNWADGTKESHQEAVSRIRDLVLREDFIEMLNQAADEVTVFGLTGFDFGQQVDEDHWESETVIDGLHVAGSKIT